MDVKKTAERIRKLKVQGAENIAIAAIDSVKELVLKSKEKEKARLLLQITQARQLLFDSRPTEPEMRNAINIILYGIEQLNDVSAIKNEVSIRAETMLQHFKRSKQAIAEEGQKLIKNNARIFTHCHSSTVISVIKKAKESGKNFIVNNTETRPLLQGRITAKELARLGITVHHYVDNAADNAIDDSDMAFFGCDAITPTGVYNKIGTRLYCEHAKRKRIPVYICTNSLKFADNEEVIEQRNASEVWKNSPKNIIVHNPAFVKVPPELITGIISEFGIMNFGKFVKTAKRNSTLQSRF